MTTMPEWLSEKQDKVEQWPPKVCLCPGTCGHDPIWKRVFADGIVTDPELSQCALNPVSVLITERRRHRHIRRFVTSGL